MPGAYSGGNPSSSGSVTVSGVSTEAKQDDQIALATDGSQKTQLTDGTDDLPLGPVTAATGTVSSSGDSPIVAVPGGQKIRLFHISFVPDPGSSNDVVVIVKIGAAEKYTWRCNKAGSGFSRSPKSGQGWVAGADGEDLILNLSAAESVSWNAEYDLVPA